MFKITILNAKNGAGIMFAGEKKDSRQERMG